MLHHQDILILLGFLSIQAQDFIEDVSYEDETTEREIPEHSSSGLH